MFFWYSIKNATPCLVYAISHLFIKDGGGLSSEQCSSSSFVPSQLEQDLSPLVSSHNLFSCSPSNLTDWLSAGPGGSIFFEGCHFSSKDGGDGFFFFSCALPLLANTTLFGTSSLLFSHGLFGSTMQGCW